MQVQSEAFPKITHNKTAKNTKPSNKPTPNPTKKNKTKDMNML